MSDEQRPLSLRLRPRSNPAPAPVPGPVVPPAPENPSTTEAAPTGDAMAEVSRLRLKPRTPPPQEMPQETPLPFSNPPIEPPPPAPQEAEAAEPPPAEVEAVSEVPAAEPVAYEPDPVEAEPAPAVLPEDVPAPEPIPVPEPEPEAYVPPAPVYAPAPPVPVPPPVATVPPIAEPPPIKADKWLAGLVVMVVVMGATFWGIHGLLKLHPRVKPAGHLPSAVREEAPAPASAATAPAARPHLVDHPVSAAGQAIARARDTVAAIDRREREEGVDQVLETAPAPTAPPRTAAASPASAAPAPAVSAAPAAPAAPEPPPTASDEFRDFVAKLRVNGVFQGEHARAMLNGRTYDKGDVVDEKLGVKFIGVDVDAKLLIFTDDTGAKVTRRY